MKDILPSFLLPETLRFDDRKLLIKICHCFRQLAQTLRIAVNLDPLCLQFFAAGKNRRQPPPRHRQRRISSRLAQSENKQDVGEAIDVIAQAVPENIFRAP